MIGKVERIQSRDMHKGNSGFGNGVVVGVVMGVILTLLFTTKKGRKILRILSEEGFEKVKKWEHILDGLELDDDMEEDGDYIPTEKEKKQGEKKVFLARK